MNKNENSPLLDALDKINKIPSCLEQKVICSDIVYNMQKNYSNILIICRYARIVFCVFLE